MKRSKEIGKIVCLKGSKKLGKSMQEITKCLKKCMEEKYLQLVQRLHKKHSKEINKSTKKSS